MSTNTKHTVETVGLTPSQTVGPYFSIGLAPQYVSEIFLESQHESRISITGTVLDGNGVPVPDAIIEVWQANESGIYSENSSGFGRIATNDDGGFSFTTIKPGAVRGSNDISQAPHLLVSIFMRGILKQLNTRLYFADESEANKLDTILQSVSMERQKTLIADMKSAHMYTFDIILQGSEETVFFSY